MSEVLNTLSEIVRGTYEDDPDDDKPSSEQALSCVKYLEINPDLPEPFVVTKPDGGDVVLYWDCSDSSVIVGFEKPGFVRYHVIPNELGKDAERSVLDDFFIPSDILNRILK